MLRLKLHTVYGMVLFLFLFIVVGRGFFELLMDKTLAFLVQALSVIFFIIVSLLFFKIRIKTKYFFSQLIFCAVFLFSIIVSISITIYLKNGGAPFFYSAIIFFLIIAFVFISSFNFNKVNHINIGNMIFFLIMVLFAVSLYEQITKTLMPGAWWYGNKVRPASLTGSKQHYSIILSILSLFIFQYWLKLRKYKYLLGFTIGVVGVILSLTRSGSMILALAFFPFLCYKAYHTPLIKINLKLLLLVLVALILSSFFFLDLEFFISRMISALDTNSPGNDDRVKAWLLAWDLLSSSNLLFGEYTGVVTNATRTVTSTTSFVVESGTLQMILNYGLIGFLSFYFALLNVYTLLKREDIFLFFVLISCLLSTTIYQSIETIPFIILLSFVPLISGNTRNLKQRMITR